MKLKQNARELVLLELSGMGTLMGEVRYNKQTETVIFALEKSAFFDLYLPCTVGFDPQRGSFVQPHVVNAMTTGSIRIQRSRVNFFVLSQDIAPSLKAQYMDIVHQLTGMRPQSQPTPESTKPKDKVVELLKLKGKKDDRDKK